MGIFVQEVSSDTDNDGRAEPCKGIATGDGEACNLGGNCGNHVDYWCGGGDEVESVVV